MYNRPLIYPLLIGVIVLAFFARMFYPDLAVFITPEFGQSDLFHLNYPMKFFLSDSLAQGHLPLWNDYIGTGFPQLAEGQIGALNMTNLLLYTFIPFPYVINVAYVVMFLTAALGSYFYLRFLHFERIVAFLCAILFSFSGYFITHAIHINVVHASSYLPWIFLLAHAFIRTNKLFYALILSLVVSQQYFAGHPQTTFITLLGITLLYVHARRKQLFHLGTYFIPLVTLLIVCGLIAVQFMPSHELLNISNRKDGFNLDQATRFSFPIGHVMGFIDPNFLGSPKDGTYPDFNTLKGSIYWENTGYIGILPLVLIMLALLMKKKSSLHVFYVFLLTVAFVLMLGKHSPFHPIFTIPPFSMFRVPSRFMLLLVWSMTVLSAFGFQWMLEFMRQRLKNNLLRQFVTYLLVTVSVVQLLHYGYNYNPIGTAKDWLRMPALTQNIPDDKRFYTIGSEVAWNKHYVNAGWSHLEPYLQLLNYAEPNFNVLYKKPAFEVYPILISLRYQVMANLIEREIVLDDSLSSFEVSDLGIKLLRMNNTSTIVSAMNNNTLEIIAEKNSSYDKVSLYSVPNPLQRVRMVYDFDIATTVEEFQDKVADNDFDPATTILLENNPTDTLPLEQTKHALSTIDVVAQEPTTQTIKVTTNQNGILVMSDLYYPGWSAYINASPTEIFPANVAQRAIVIPKGEHLVTFTYQPKSFRQGAIISLITHVVVFILIFVVSLLATRYRRASTL